MKNSSIDLREEEEEEVVLFLWGYLVLWMSLSMILMVS